MNFCKKDADIFVPDNTEIKDALRRTKYMAIAAHQDDVEIMAFGGVLEARNDGNGHFAALICADGAGSELSGKLRKLSEDEIKKTRFDEQKKAAEIGQYNALIQLGYKSSELKEKINDNFNKDLEQIFAFANPEIVYTHNPADSHETHIAVAVKTILFLKSLPSKQKPKKVYGCEVWRSLDWLSDNDKIVFDVSGFDELSEKLLNVFESQNNIKNYAAGTAGRYKANAVFYNGKINSDRLSFALDLTPLIYEDINISDYICILIDRFKENVKEKINKFSVIY